MKFKLKRVSDRWLIFILLLLFAGLMGVLWDYGHRLNVLWSQSGTGSTSVGNTNATANSYIESAIKVLYTNQAVTDPVNERVYIPEAHIYLPMTDLSRGLFYNNQPASGGAPQAVSLNTFLNLNSVIKDFSDVPCAQRLAGFTIDSQDNSALANTKYDSSYQLNDGRTLYFYVNATSGCKVRWSPQTPDKVIALLKQAQSY